MVADRTRENCKSWQTLKFDRRPVVFIKITGTHNTANEVFHCVHFECPAPSEMGENRSQMATATTTAITTTATTTTTKTIFKTLFRAYKRRRTTTLVSRTTKKTNRNVFFSSFLPAEKGGEKKKRKD